MENWTAIALVIVLVLVIIWFMKDDGAESFGGDNSLERKDCPMNMMPTLDGPCLNLQDPDLYKKVTVSDNFMPLNKNVPFLSKME